MNINKSEQDRHWRLFGRDHRWWEDVRERVNKERASGPFSVIRHGADAAELEQPWGLPLPEFRRLRPDLSRPGKKVSYEYLVVIPGYPGPWEKQWILLNEYDLSKLKRFCERCRWVFGKRFPPRWSFWRVNPERVVWIMPKPWIEHIEAQKKIAEALSNEYIAQERIIREQYSADIKQIKSNTPPYQATLTGWLRNETAMHDRYEGLIRYAKNKLVRGDGMAPHLLVRAIERRFQKQMEVMFARWEEEETRRKEYMNTILQPATDIYEAELEKLQEQMDKRRLELQPKPVVVVRRARPGRPPVQRDKAVLLIKTEIEKGGGVALVQALEDAARDGGVGWKAMVAAGKQLGVKEKVRVGVVWGWKLG